MCIMRYKICTEQQLLLWKMKGSIPHYNLQVRLDDPDVFYQLYTPAEHCSNRKSSMQQLTRIEGISRSSDIYLLRNQHFPTGCTAKTQTTTRVNQIFEQAVSDAFHSCLKGSTVNKNYKCHHEVALKGHKTVCSE